MADATDDIRAALEKQIADLKKDIGKLGKSLGSRASDVADDASESYETMRGQVVDKASEMGTQLRKQANHAADVARENPATTATVLATVGVLGLAAGLMIAGAFGDRRR